MRRFALFVAVAIALSPALAPALSPGAALAEDAALCAAPPGGVPIIAPLEHFAARIDKGGPLNIVAVGSSSTSGTGASSPDLTYPNRLEAGLRQAVPQLEIHVVNRGKGGEDAPEELARLAGDVVAPHPDLAIWQVGTNAVLRRDDLAADGEWMREGVELMTKNGIDVVLMDLQYAPRVLDRSATPAMEDLVANTADRAHIGLFRRFALMRYWQKSQPADAPAMIGADGLHMTDAGYDCLARDLTAALIANWRAERKLAERPRDATDALAVLANRPADAR
ncbi:MAG TPA: GDSL-type esterase/lipase family protein [Stellaceae bacterium]|jgi:lysophospholipase L1-like esterase|nr:GDSL-type esterase/lipase family protein [Stellaceae bacterium]